MSSIVTIFFGCVIWNLETELFFKGHNEFNGIETVSTEIVDKTGISENF
jgi:hypothetical protein